MPLLKTLQIGTVATIILWKIEEQEEQMLDEIILHGSDKKKYGSIRNPVKKREFLALRCCLKKYFGENPEVRYQESGKPFLQNGKFISFSHTHGYAGMIISEKLPVGIDLESHRKGVLRIARKFMREEEQYSVRDETKVEQVIHYWGAKEVMVKITGNRRLNFKKELKVAPFVHTAFSETTGLIRTKDYTKRVKLYFKTIDNLHLSFGWEM